MNQDLDFASFDLNLYRIWTLTKTWTCLFI